MNYPQNQQYPQQNGYQPQAPVQNPQFQQPQYAPPAPQYPQYGQPQAPVQLYPQQYPQVQGVPAPPVQPAARGSLADAYTQGAQSAQYGTTVKFPQQGWEFRGIVARDLLDTDVTQETEYGTRIPKWRNNDGVTPRWQMVIPVNVQPSADHPEGKGTVWAKTFLLQAVTRAMVAAGIDIQNGETLKQGDELYIQRIADRPSNKGNPAHDFTAVITRANPTAPNATTTYTPVPAAANPYPAVSGTASPAPSYNPPAQVPGPYAQQQFPQAVQDAQAQASQLAQQAGVQYQAPVPPTPFATAPVPGGAQATPAAPVTASSVPFTPGSAPAATTGASETPAPVPSVPFTPAPAATQTPAPAPSSMQAPVTASSNPGIPGLVPGSYQEILVRSLTGQPVTEAEQAILNAGPPQ